MTKMRTPRRSCLWRAVSLGVAGLVLLGAVVAGATSSSAQETAPAKVRAKAATLKHEGGTLKRSANRPGLYRLNLRGVNRAAASGTRRTVVVALDHAGPRHDAIALRLVDPHYFAGKRKLSALARVLPAEAINRNPRLWSQQGRVDRSIRPRFGAGELIGYTAPPASQGCAVCVGNPSQILKYAGETVQTVTVPEGAEGVYIEAIGGGGAVVENEESPTTSGANVKGLVAVEPGETLLVAVAGAGHEAYAGTKGKDAHGGWGGLGAVGGDGPSTDGNIHSGGAGGGGASTVELVSKLGTVTPVLIAGGGGGQGGDGLSFGGGGGQGGNPNDGNGNPGYTSKGGEGGKQGVLTTFAGGFGQSVSGTSGNGGGGGAGGYFTESESHVVTLQPGGGQGGRHGSGGYGAGGGAAGLSGVNPQKVKGVDIETASREFAAQNGQVSITWVMG